MRARRRSTRRGARPSPPSSCDSTAMCSAPCRAMRRATTTSAPTRSWCCSMFSRIELWLALLLAVAVGVAVFAGVRSPKPTPENEPPSTFLTGPGGSKALYDVLARLGQPVERRRAALFDLTRDARHRRARGGLRKGGGCRALPPTATDTLPRPAFRGGPVTARLRSRGGGQGVLAADPEYFRNRRWRDSDVPLLVTPLLLPPPPKRGRVSWDEYHHGYGREASVAGAVLAWLTRSPGGGAILQLVAVRARALAPAPVALRPA